MKKYFLTEKCTPFHRIVSNMYLLCILRYFLSNILPSGLKINKMWTHKIHSPTPQPPKPKSSWLPVLWLKTRFIFFNSWMPLWCLAGGAGDVPDLQSGRALKLPRLRLSEPTTGLLLISSPNALSESCTFLKRSYLEIWQQR